MRANSGDQDRDGSMDRCQRVLLALPLLMNATDASSGADLPTATLLHHKRCCAGGVQLERAECVAIRWLG